MPDKSEDLISVIVPVWNAEEFLREALESLRTQTYADFEAILVNDGSTDKSADICREFCTNDSRFRLLSQSNGGVSAARNAGISDAKGNWIAFMDADDMMVDDALEVLMTSAKNSGSRIAVGAYTRSLAKTTTGTQSAIHIVTSREAIIIGLYQKKILNSPCGVLYHTSVFNEVHPLRFRSCRYEDLDLFYQAFERVDNVCIVDKKVYHYRDTPASFINSWSDARLDVLDVTDRMKAHFQDTDVGLLKAASDRRFSAHFNMLVEMERYGIDNETQKERCWNVIKRGRWQAITDRNVRLKNKIGAFVSYFGKSAIKLLCKF